MSIWAETFLAIIAASTLAIAIVLVGVFVVVGLFFRRLKRLVDTVEGELKPIFGHVNAMARDASRATALATAQVERVDHLFGEITRRLEQLMNTLQSTLTQAREGRAMWSAFWAALGAVQELRDNARARRARGEDEDALFI